jgi:hypothetical protein
MKTFADLNFKDHPTGRGLQALMFFDNGYGVSVERFKVGMGFGSYTDNDDEWELAVLKGTESNWSLTYDTDITDDVLGHLSNDEVTEIMKKVQSL